MTYIIQPAPDNSPLCALCDGIDQDGTALSAAVVREIPLTIFLNRQEIVTTMTIGDYPEYLAAGYLANQMIVTDPEQIADITHDAEAGVVVVRTHRETSFEARQARRIRTSGCAEGTMFDGLMERMEDIVLPSARVSTRQIQTLAHIINRTDSLYLHAGAIHGCVLCRGEEPLVYMEDVGRHNAVDKIAGYMLMEQVCGDDKLLYTTGRLTSEMVIKTVLMRIPALVSRSGFTVTGVDIARKFGLTLIGRARGRRFLALSAPETIVFDSPGKVEE